ncbi:putative GNAT family acetyltransferase [Podospora appendiculata]|uniref:GNAT family acetyltransferase n=1 Tax=Podospora appendiculata TaxID=314037 RepID=A0AAE0X898_9PEZI|nr:putative GNAT family acetyltransferase [Podospora appendiculata]
MPLVLLTAEESDIERIAEIHMAAFGPNILLQAQFPTPSAREELRRCIAEKALDDIRDPKTQVLIVRDDDNIIISFAKWNLPVQQDEDYTEPPWRWPDETNYKVLNAWTKKVDGAKECVIGNSPCYHLSFIGTDPQHQRRGAASLLVGWAVKRCKEENVPAYLESTGDALRLYESFGFTVERTIEMELEGMGPHGSSVVYEEMCFLFRP